MDITELTGMELRNHLRVTQPAANWTIHEILEPELAQAF